MEICGAGHKPEDLTPVHPLCPFANLSKTGIVMNYSRIANLPGPHTGLIFAIDNTLAIIRPLKSIAGRKIVKPSFTYPNPIRQRKLLHGTRIQSCRYNWGS